MTITEDELREYIKRRLRADEEHLNMTAGTQWHEPDFYEGAKTALNELWLNFELGDTDD